MLSTQQFTFLEEKISDLKTALFISQHNSVLKFPTSIVNALKVDEAGQVWFLMTRPAQYLQEFDKEFPVKLDFFRKGKDHFLKIAGKAFIVNDPEEINSLVSISDDVKRDAMRDYVLVKVRIMKAEYFETSRQPDGRNMLTFFHKIYSRIFSFRHANRPFAFQPEPSM